MENAANTQVTCSSCGQMTSVPFVPTPGRPVYCRECFAKRSPDGGARRGPPSRGPPPSGGGGFRPRFGGGDSASAGERPRPVSGQRKRMLAQGRKGHFIFDARAVMRRSEGGMDDQHHRAFLEGLFARGSRDSTAAAQDFLDEKLADKTITPEERNGLGQLLERYSFWR
ncbi:MAG TPA: CxxC-x17-CxxC domain-containing protein [Candidatus Thermoplasmatota archaeon]|nr:CxxC-x17-CxxC domain-containing protein [Candidatus Thermoplasmatota archaeon]